jgi:hypothetical protein
MLVRQHMKFEDEEGSSDEEYQEVPKAAGQS